MWSKMVFLVILGDLSDPLPKPSQIFPTFPSLRRAAEAAPRTLLQDPFKGPFQTTLLKDPLKDPFKDPSFKGPLKGTL